MRRRRASSISRSIASPIFIPPLSLVLSISVWLHFYVSFIELVSTAGFRGGGATRKIVATSLHARHRCCNRQETPIIMQQRQQQEKIWQGKAET